MAKKTIQIVTRRNWQAEELQAKGWETRQSFGLDVPAHKPGDSWWFPQDYAVRINKSLENHNLPPLKLTSPNSQLLPNTPREHTGRRIGLVSVYDALNSFVEWPDNLWWKMATAKNDNFFCQPLNHDQLIALLETLNLPYDSLLHFSEPLPTIISEHRFFVADRAIKAHSGYLKEGVTVYEGSTFTEDETSAAYLKAEEVLNDDSFEMPRAFVMDVAVTVKGAFVLEYNPAWCSGWYDCEIPGVLDSIKLSTNPTKKEMKLWGYEPDELLKIRNSFPLPLAPVK
jgi:hypothetical protein